MVRLIALLLLLPTVSQADEARWRQIIGPEAGATSLAVVDDVVVAGTWTSELVALDAPTGKVLWRQPHPEQAGSSLMVAVAGGKVLAGVPGLPTLTGRDARSGKESWKRDLPGGAASLAACPGYRLAAVTHRGRAADGRMTLLVHALDPVDGRTLWQKPTDGILVGSAPGWLFTATPEGTGRLMARLSAWRCSDGVETRLGTPDRKFSAWVTADEKRVISTHYDFGFQRQLLCSTELASQAQACFEATDGEVPLFGVTGALLRGDVLHFATAHPMAHNLDPSPDGWILRYDLAAGRYLGRSEPLSSNGLLADAGEQIVSAFGTTGAEDFAYLIDPQGERLKSVPMKKAPRQVTADGQRAYIATYDGGVVAIDLVRPGVKALPEVEVATQALPQAAKGPDLGWTLLRSFVAHPLKAKSSGSMGEGSLNDVAFLDSDTLLVGGNDDRAALWSVEGKRLWQSPNLAKDVQRVGACEGGFAVQTYAGDVFTFGLSGTKYRSLRHLKPGFGWAFGVTSRCDVLVDNFEGDFQLIDGKSGKPLVNFAAKGVFDRRGVRVEGSKVIVSHEGRLDALDLMVKVDEAVTSWPTPTQAHDGALAQAWLLPDGRLLREYVGPAKGVIIEILPAGGGPAQHTLEFDLTGHGWSPTVPSMIVASPDGATLAFFRRDLDLLLVDVATGRTQPLFDVAGPQAGLVQAAFSPDGRRLAIVGHPRAYEITVLERR